MTTTPHRLPEGSEVLDHPWSVSNLLMRAPNGSWHDGLPRHLWSVLQRRGGGHVHAPHYAVMFVGYIWYADHHYHEEIWKDQEYSETMSARTMTELILAVNAKHGWD